MGRSLPSVTRPTKPGSRVKSGELKPPGAEGLPEAAVVPNSAPSSVHLRVARLTTGMGTIPEGRLGYYVVEADLTRVGVPVFRLRRQSASYYGCTETG